MAELINPFNGDNDNIEEVFAAELSKNDDLVNYIEQNSLDALKKRFGAAEEDENIRNEGFRLAKKGGLIKKAHPEGVLPYMARDISPKEDIQTDSDSELSKVFDLAKSEHDSDNIYFSDLNIENKGKASEKAQEEKAEEKPAEKEPEAAPEEPKPVKRKRGRPRKVQPEAEKAAEKAPKPVEDKTEAALAEMPQDDENIYVMMPKYNTHTRVIFVDESLDDGIKRNSENEIESFFNEKSEGRKFKLWQRKKKN